MFRSFYLCSCLMVLVNCAILKDSSEIAPEGDHKLSDGIASSEAGGLVQGQLQMTGKDQHPETDGLVHAVSHRADENGDRTGPSDGMKLQNSEVATEVPAQVQQQNGTVLGQKISEANQKEPSTGTNEEDEEFVDDKIGSACLACLAGGGLG